MTFTHSPTISKPRLVLAAIAFVASIAVLAIASVDAQAGSGGIGEAGTGAETSKQDKKATANASRYNRLWDRVSGKNKRWARRTAECESGRDPNAIGGGGAYRGAFQFMKSTWRTSPKSPGGDPIDYSYKTQAVVAVALKKRDGAGHWPNCG